MERKISSLDDLDEDFLIVQQRQTANGMVSKRASVHGPTNGPTLRPTSLDKPLGFRKAPSQRSIHHDAEKDAAEPHYFLKDLLDVIDKDDLELFKGLQEDLKQKGLSFAARSLHSEDGKNVLHFSLEMEAVSISEYLIGSLEVKLLVESYFTPSASGRKTCLHILAEKSSLHLMEALLLRTASLSSWRLQEFYKQLSPVNLDDKQIQLMTALHIAAMKGDTEIVKLLVDNNYPVDVTNEACETPMMWAIKGGHHKTVKSLVEHGAGVNAEDDKGSTPLYWATRYGQSLIVHYLLSECNVNVNHRRKFGYILPLVLASGVGYTPIVLDLLKYGAKVNAKVTGGKVALHHAASQGHVDIVLTLLQYGAKINTADDAGNTPLMLATKEGHMEVIQTLLGKGADMTRKNKMGQTVWDFIMDTEGTALLSMYVNIYKNVNDITSMTIFRFERGRTPLHIAALKNDVEKVRCLLKQHVDWTCSDDMGNTFLHIAAKENCVEILEEFALDYDICVQNEHGETPLHIAVKYGYHDSVLVLLSRATLATTNKRGSTPLHTAAWSLKSNRDIVRTLVETAVTCNSWSLLDSQDSKGNTALHIAAKKGRMDIIEELQALDPSVTNREGNTALHVAAMSGVPGVLECLLEVFGSSPEEEYPDATFQRYDLDQMNGCGDTVLHICARVGDAEGVKGLIEGGASMELKNDRGNTVLHDLVEQSVQSTTRKESYLQVYSTMVELAPVWWCKRRGAVIPDEDSPLLGEHRRTAMLYLTSDILNAEGRCVTKHCVSVGATYMLEVILNTPNVYCIVSNKKQIAFDITNLTPDTEIEGVKTRREMKRKSTALLSDSSGKEEKEWTHESCLDIIISLKNEIQATKMLEITPIKQLVKNYWAAYQLVYGFFMISHIIFMAFYTKFAIESVECRKGVLNATSVPEIQPSCIDHEARYLPRTFLLLIWPVLIILFELYYMVSNLIRRRSNSKVKTSSFKRLFCEECFSLPTKALSFVVEYGNHFAAVFFALSVFVWLALYQYSISKQNYILAIALMFGWMFTISFAKGFETVHSISIILKHIVVRDITRFLFIYCFVMFGFALAFHVMFQMVPSFAQTYRSPWDTFFLTLNVMLGLEDSLFEDFESTYNAAVNFIKVLYVLYVLFSSIILLNLLIAMMTDSYSHVISREGTTWRLGSVKLALKLERSFPFLKTAFKKMGIIRNTVTFDLISQRWLMTFRQGEMSVEQREDVKDDSSMLKSLDQRVIELQTTCQALARQMDTLMKCVELINDNQQSPSNFTRGSLRYKSSKGKRSSLLQAVQKWRESALLHRRLSQDGKDPQSPLSTTSTEVSATSNETPKSTKSLQRVVSHWSSRARSRSILSNASHLEQVAEEGEVNQAFTPDESDSEINTKI